MPKLSDARIDLGGSLAPSVLVALKVLDPADYGIHAMKVDDPEGTLDSLGNIVQVWNYDVEENYLSHKIELARVKILDTVLLWNGIWEDFDLKLQQRIRETWLEYSYAHVYCDMANHRSLHIGSVSGRGGQVVTSNMQPANIRAGCRGIQMMADDLAGEPLPPLSTGSTIGVIPSIRGS